jgi:Arc/MetJ-type ribon-helix-helix transcriptional regulator
MVKVSVRIDREQSRKLEAESRASGRNASDIVRSALEQYFAARPGQETCLDLARRIGVVGHAKGLARDLSTNKDHFKGFGGD